MLLCTVTVDHVHSHLISVSLHSQEWMDSRQVWTDSGQGWMDSGQTHTCVNNTP